jgi:hypothetical protein
MDVGGGWGGLTPAIDWDALLTGDVIGAGGGGKGLMTLTGGDA